MLTKRCVTRINMKNNMSYYLPEAKANAHTVRPKMGPAKSFFWPSWFKVSIILVLA